MLLQFDTVAQSATACSGLLIQPTNSSTTYIYSPGTTSRNSTASSSPDIQTGAAGRIRTPEVWSRHLLRLFGILQSMASRVSGNTCLPGNTYGTSHFVKMSSNNTGCFMAPWINGSVGDRVVFSQVNQGGSILESQFHEPVHSWYVRNCISGIGR